MATQQVFNLIPDLREMSEIIEKSDLYQNNLKSWISL